MSRFPNRERAGRGWLPAIQFQNQQPLVMPVPNGGVVAIPVAWALKTMLLPVPIRSLRSVAA
jgi:predicted phosphoribosyltransferase